MIRDAGIPQTKQVGLIINTLRGSAADWAVLKESSFKNVDDFKNAFMKRYWNAEQERETFLNLKYGRYEKGNRADYFLKLAKESTYLSNGFSECDTVELIAQHFPPDIRRGILNSGYRDFEDVELFLRKIDKTYTEEGSRVANGNQQRIQTTNNDRRGFQNWRQRDEARAVARDEQGQAPAAGGNENRHDMNVTTVFNSDIEPDLLVEPEVVEDIPMLPKLPCVDLDVGGCIKINALIDSGSQYNCISEECHTKIEKMGVNAPAFPTKNFEISTALKRKSCRIKKQVLLSCKIKNICFDVQFIIVPGLNRDLILGLAWFHEFKVLLKMSENILEFTKEGETVKVNIDDKSEREGLEVNEVKQLNDVSVQSGSRKQIDYYTENQRRELAFSSTGFSQKNKQNLFSLLNKYQNLFSDQPGLTNKYEHEIKLKDYSPFFQASYPVPHAYLASVRKQIQEMLDWGVIAPQQTEYVNPLVVVIKKDKSVRICLDARYLNGRMVQDHVLPPNPETILFNFEKNCCLSTMDLTSSYWQVPIRQEDQKYTGFLFEGMTYVFKVLPFGLSTSVGSFIRCLDILLGPEIGTFAIPYVDDILIFSKGAEEHLKHLNIIFRRLLEGGVTVKLRKCMFARENVKFLGHILTSETVYVDPDRIKAIREFPVPRNPKHLKSFLGICNYDRRFLENYSGMTVPLLRLLKKSTPWRWTQIEQKTFEEIKEAYLKVTVLYHPIRGARFYIQTDSSYYALGAYLFQIDPETKEKRILAFMSKTLNKNELHFGKLRKETLLSKLLLPDDMTTMKDQNELIVLARERMLTKAERRREFHDRNKKFAKFNVGDWVLVRSHPQSSAEHDKIKKFFLLYKGPYKIKNKFSNSFELVNEQDASIGVYNLFNLKKYVPRCENL